MTWTCLNSPVDCLEAASFGSYAFYLPWSLIPLPVELITPEWLSSFLIDWTWASIIPFWISIHAGLGFLMAFVWRKPIRWWISILFAFTFLFSLAAIFNYLQFRQEMARETYTQLWAIYDVREGYIKSTNAEISVCENNTCPNGYRLNLVDGYTESFMLNSQDAEVTLIQCTDAGCEANYKVTFDDYLAIRQQCQEDLMSCPVYGIGGEYDLFEVTSNPRGILHMEQVYLP